MIDNFGKCRLICKILSPVSSKEYSLCTTNIYTSPALCCYTTWWNSKIQTVTEFSRWTW